MLKLELSFRKCLVNFFEISVIQGGNDFEVLDSMLAHNVKGLLPKNL